MTPPIHALFENIDSFNTLRRQLRYNNRIKEDEPYGRTQECLPRCDHNRAVADAVLRALRYLKEEQLIPTKENIQNYFRYVDGGDIDVEEALKCALEHDDSIVMQNLLDKLIS